MICNLVIRDATEEPTRTWVVPFEFDGEHENIDPETAIRAAVQDYLKSPESKEAREYAAGSFNWGDVMANIPNEFFENRGMHPAASTSIDIEVEHDEVLSLDNELDNEDEEDRAILNNQVEKEWLKQLQQDLIDDREKEKTQASPIYYGIYDYKEQPVPEGHEDHIEFYDPSSCETVNLQEYFNELDDEEKKELYEDDDSGISKDENGDFYIDCESDFANYLADRFDFVPVYFADIGYICPNSMFLTRKDAQAHLNSNKHHYSTDAKTYAMTAWRSPRVGHLLKLLTEIDWDRSNVVLKEER